MITTQTALSAIPKDLRQPLIDEYTSIINNFIESRWRPAELSGGRFCEIVYTILDGYASGTFADKPQKPPNFTDACKRLEQRTGIPRSFQILIPRLLPALYEIRNNRNVGHVGGDVNPDYMDSNAVVAISGWIMAELIRVFHDVTSAEAQSIVDSLVERRITCVWKADDIRRVLRTDFQLKDQLFLLLLSCPGGQATFEDLLRWLEYKNRNYFIRLVRNLHDHRLLEYTETKGIVQLLPPGTDYTSALMNKINRI